MRRTRLGVLVLAVGYSCFALAFVARSVAPAILGVLLVAAVLAQRPPARHVELERAIPHEVTEGESFEVTIDARGAQGCPIYIDFVAPPTVQVVSVERQPGRGHARLRMTCRAGETGVIVWGNAIVRVQDAWGFVEHEHALPFRDNVRVIPGAQALKEGRAASRREEISSKAKRGLLADWESETERLRDYQPGDRLRDIDWSHSTKLEKLIARERSRNSLLPIVLLLEATRSVRWKRRVSKFDTMRQTALGVMAAAQSASIAAGFVAYDDRGIAAQVRVSASRRAIAGAVHAISEMRPVEPVDEVEASPISADVMVAPTPQERAFLQAIARFDRRAPRGLTPLEAALGAVSRVSPQPALVICLLDVEEAPALAKTVVQRLARHGHRCIVAAPASGPHHYALDEVDDVVLDSLVTWRQNREAAARACRDLRAPFLVLYSKVDASSIEEVIRSTRSA